jgi:hypothetical protein
MKIKSNQQQVIEEKALMQAAASYAKLKSKEGKDDAGG